MGRSKSEHSREKKARIVGRKSWDCEQKSPPTHNRQAREKKKRKQPTKTSVRKQGKEKGQRHIGGMATTKDRKNVSKFSQVKFAGAGGLIRLCIQ